MLYAKHNGNGNYKTYKSAGKVKLVYICYGGKIAFAQYCHGNKRKYKRRTLNKGIGFIKTDALVKSGVKYTLQAHCGTGNN